MADTRTITLRFNGRDIDAKPLTQSQLIALSASKFMASTGDVTSRYFQVVRSRVGGQWDQMYEDILDGSDDDGRFTDFLQSLIKLSTAQTESADDVSDEIRKAEEFLAKHRTESGSGG